jgi:uncharacterized protein (TIGR03067 family)
MPEPAVAEVRGADLRSVVGEELSRLPDHYRGVVVLCDLEDMTRKQAARQLGIPEGSVASRLARARALLAKRLARRGVVISGSVAAVLLAGSAAASAPPALVASTIKAARLLAAGQAAGVVSAKVAALTEGVVQNMFVTRIKSVLAVVLLVATLASAVGMIYRAPAAEPPKSAPTKAEEKPMHAPPAPPPAKTDRERMVGNWFIINADSQRQGEMWVITEDSILMHAKNLGANTHHYAHRLDAGKNPRQIDITVTRVKGPTVGVIKGIYVLAGDEPRLCLGEMGKDRPAAFPEKPGTGEVLVLRRERWGAASPTAKGAQPEPKVLTPEQARKQLPKERVTVQFKVASVEVTGPYTGYPVCYCIYFTDGGKFIARWCDYGDQPDREPRKLALQPVQDYKGKVVRVTGRVEPDADNFISMWLHDPADIVIVKE